MHPSIQFFLKDGRNKAIIDYGVKSELEVFKAYDILTPEGDQLRKGKYTSITGTDGFSFAMKHYVNIIDALCYWLKKPGFVSAEDFDTYNEILKATFPNGWSGHKYNLE